MIAEERWDEILAIVSEKRTVTVPELAAALATSESTVRRDLARLDSMQKLIKVHGGATSIENRPSYVMLDQANEERYVRYSDEKSAIAQYAASLIGEEDFVYIDAGTTTERLVDLITPGGAVYVTNSIGHARKLLRKGCRVILPGGELKPVTEALVGADAVDSIRRFHFTLGFWGTNGVTDDTGFTTPEPNEAAVKRCAMEHTANRYVLCDHSKFSVVSPVSFAAFNYASIITDGGIEERYRTYSHIHIVS